MSALGACAVFVARAGDVQAAVHHGNPLGQAGQAAWELRASRSKISRMEHGRVRFKDRDVADLLTL